ncbi:hypothetical protein [Paenibacillus senegalensis]|uniref:hypothetical protein n=1 Tax=Paenibacillus senegalensis TaxID=1465766 RepID=UPI0011DE467C|nr:hypothetical protein [Paenibacillus senegalensis]
MQLRVHRLHEQLLLLLPHLTRLTPDIRMLANDVHSEWNHDVHQLSSGRSFVQSSSRKLPAQGFLSLTRWGRITLSHLQDLLIVR